MLIKKIKGVVFMSSILGKCSFLKSCEDKSYSFEYENCPRMLSESDKRLLLDSLSGKLIDFGTTLERFLSDDSFSAIDVDSYFYMYYRKMDCLLYWADVHLEQMKHSDELHD